MKAWVQLYGQGTACLNSLKISSLSQIWQCYLQMAHKITYLHHLLLCNQPGGSAAPWKAAHLLSLLGVTEILAISLQCASIITFREALRYLFAPVERGQDLKEALFTASVQLPAAWSASHYEASKQPDLQRSRFHQENQHAESQALQWYIMAIYSLCPFSRI